MNDDDEIDKLIDAACETDPIDVNEFIDEEAGPPLSNAEVRQARIELAKWHLPTQFRSLVRSLHRRIHSSDYFSRPDLKFLQDAFVIGEFVHRKPVEEVRLALESERWPDGFVRLADKVHKVEVTSTHGGRRLGDEYRRSDKTTFERIEVEELARRAALIPQALTKAIEAKIAKQYADAHSAWLVVYLNINEHGIRQVETERAIEAIKQRFASAFESLFVVWKEKVL